MEASWLAFFEMPLKIGAVFAAYVFVVCLIGQRLGVNTRSEVFGALVFASFMILTGIYLVVVNLWAPGLMSPT